MALLTCGRPKGGLRRLVVAAALALASVATLAKTHGVITADPAVPLLFDEASLDQPGWLDIDFNPDALAALGVRVVGQSRGHLRLSVIPGDRPLKVALGDGAPTAIGDGALRVTGLLFHRGDGARSPALHLTGGGNGLDLSLRDDRGREWARIEQVMRSPDTAGDGFRYVTANLSTGPALSGFAGMAADRRLLGNASLQLPMPRLTIAKSEANPVWPGTPGTITDVLLIDMPNITTDVPGIATSRCRVLGGGAPCDGPGGSEGEVVITPSARLRNSQFANTTDVPWYRMFSESTSLYPDVGPKIDQHPYLVWNLYRVDADGAISQIARSGLKHAFATGNEMCSGYTPYGHILGPACSDLYNLTSNDCDRFLGPRSEIIPATGQWARCGSIQDPDCDGDTEPAIPAGFSCAAAYSSPASDKYSYRLLARETDIDPDLHPGARWFMDAWYVIRDDEDISNSMGFRELTLAWLPTFSQWSVASTDIYQQGMVIDQWLADAELGETTYRTQIDTPEGEVGVAVRIRQLMGGDYRYDYAIMNFDFARVRTDPATAEPNLRILDSAGIGSLEFRLSDCPRSDRRTVDLPWGNLTFVRLQSPQAPQTGELRLHVAGSGSPSYLSADVPQPPSDAGVHCDGYE